MQRSFWWNLFRWGFALACLAFVLGSGKLQVSDVKAFLSRPMLVAAGLVLLGVGLCSCFLRWTVLLRGVGVAISFREAVHLGMIGQFFSAVIPGTVGGDLVKAVYVAKHFPQAKTKSVTTIFLDRIVGLGGMLVLGAMAVVLTWGHLSQLSHPNAPLIHALCTVVVVLAIVGVSALALLPWVGSWIPREWPSPNSKLPLREVVTQMVQAIHLYRSNVHCLWLALALGVFNHIVNVSLCALAAVAVFGTDGWGTLTAGSFGIGAILGNAAMAIPVAPMGLGVGQVAFGSVFSVMGAPSVQFGAALVTGVQLWMLTGNLCGVFFFLNKKRSVAPAV